MVLLIGGLRFLLCSFGFFIVCMMAGCCGCSVLVVLVFFLAFVFWSVVRSVSGARSDGWWGNHFRF